MNYLTYLLILAGVVFGAIIVLSGTASWLWNKKYRPYRMQQGRPTDTFGRIMTRVRRFIFKEETGSIFQKPAKDPSETPKPVAPALEKITYRKVYLVLLGLIVIFALTAYFVSILGVFAAGAALILLLTIWGRTAPIFQSRHKVLARMFDVASSQFKYGKGSEMDPWTYVQVQKWDNLIIPADTAIAIPNTYRSDIPMNRDSFEAHFSNIVTDENSWDYEWNSVKNQVIAHPVRHLPTNAPYPGSTQFEWDTIPIGEGIAGPVTFNVSQVPHTLVAGPTGSGKSVLQRNLLFHCIQHNDVWRFVGIDLKRVELSVYKRYSKTVKAIAVDLETGVELTRQIKDTMMERYTIMENAGVNHFLQLRDEHGQHPKAIMLMVDEAFVFLSPEGAKTDEGKQRDQWHGEAVTLLGEIARLGRAAGIHLIIATQRPDAAVIPGELRSNLENRIAAGRLNSTSSSMILDSGAGTRLPKIKGRGAISISGEVAQFQGYFAPQNWIDEWLANHKDREPSLFGLPDDEDDVFGEDEDGVDFLPTDQLEFDIDEAARELLQEGKTDFPDMLLPDGELPEIGAGADYTKTTTPVTPTSPTVRAAEEAAALAEADDEDEQVSPKRGRGLLRRRRVTTDVVTPDEVQQAPAPSPMPVPVTAVTPEPPVAAPTVVEPALPVPTAAPAPEPANPAPAGPALPPRPMRTPPPRPTMPPRPTSAAPTVAQPVTNRIPPKLPPRPAQPPRFPGVQSKDN